MFEFKGKIAVVTGASSGIGKEIAKRFYEAGASVALCSRSLERVYAAAEEFARPADPRVCCVQADTAVISDIESFVAQTIKRFGKIDIFVNNAGVQFPKPSVEVTEPDWDNTVNTNLKGYFFGAQAAAKDMLRRNQGGVIINIGSVNAVTVVVGQAVYAATKAGISQMTKSLAREWGKQGIRVNCVAPGSVPTLINREIYKDPAVEKAMCDKIPLGRRGGTKEIADVVLYLASDYASYITGQTVFVDGGLTLAHG
jgi:NAD(P)-dependent dehydrogenase (short-subunit alcohol dehydrogenase family)